MYLGRSLMVRGDRGFGIHAKTFPVGQKCSRGGGGIDVVGGTMLTDMVTRLTCTLNFPLQEMTLQHIIADTDILMREVDAYSNLPDDLKDEIRKVLSSVNPHLVVRHSNPTGLQEAPATVVSIVGSTISHVHRISTRLRLHTFQSRFESTSRGGLNPGSFKSYATGSKLKSSCEHGYTFKCMEQD